MPDPESGSGRLEMFADLVQEGRDAVAFRHGPAAQFAQDGSFSAGPACLFAAPGRPVHHQRDGHGHEEEDQQRQNVFRVNHRERTDRPDAEVVHDQPCQDRGHHSRPEPSEQGDRHDAGQLHQHVRGQLVMGKKVQDELQERGEPDREGECRYLPAAAQTRPGSAGRLPVPGRVLRDKVNVDAARIPQDLRHASASDTGQRPVSRHSQNDLAGVDAPRKIQQRCRDVLSADARGNTPPTSRVSLRCSSSSLPENSSFPPEPVRTWTAWSSPPVTARQHSRRAADQGLALGFSTETDNDLLPAWPAIRDVLPDPVVGQPGIDPLGQPQQGKLPERRQGARPEVAGQRCVCLLLTA